MLESGQHLSSPTGVKLLERLKNGSTELSLFDLFPVLDMREDKLCEVRGEFGYEVKLTKVEHRPQRERDERRRSARRGEGKPSKPHKSFSKGRKPKPGEKVYYVKVEDGQAPHHDEKKEEQEPKRQDSKKREGKAPNKKRQRSRARDEEVYVKKVDKPTADGSAPKEEVIEEKPKRETSKGQAAKPKPRRPAAKRDRSGDYEFVPKTAKPEEEK